MTQTRAQEPVPEQVTRRKVTQASPYAEILRQPGALKFCAAAFLGRLPMSMAGLGTVVLIAAVTGHYGDAGAVAAVSSISLAVAAPRWGALADRLGQRRVLLPLVTVNTLATAALIVAVLTRLPLAVLILLAAVAGAASPMVGSMVRIRWSALLAGSPLLETAFALESVADEVIFIIGPVIVTLLATGVHPAAGLIVSAAAGLAGTLLYASQRRTEPPPHTRAALARPRPGQRRLILRPGPAPAPGLITLVPVYWLLGAMFATIELSTVAFARAQGHAALAGLILGSYAAGSGAGGLWYGSRHWRAPLSRRLVASVGWIGIGAAALWWQPDIWSLSGVIVIAGLGIAPTLIAGVSLIERQALPGRATEGLTWASSALSVGIATGSSVAGHLVDSYGARAGYAFAGGCGLVAFAISLAGIRQLRTVPPAQAQA